MMNKFTSKSLISRLCLISYILLCSVLTIENAFSIPWKTASKDITFNKKDQSIIFILYSFYNNTENPGVFNYLNELKLEYTVDGKVFTELLSTEIDFPESKDFIWAKIKFINNDEIIRFKHSDLYYKAPYQWIKMEILKTRCMDKKGDWGFTNYGLLQVKWNLPKSIKSIKSFRLTGKWNSIELGKQQTEPFGEEIKVNFVRPFIKIPKSNNNLKVIGTGDIISVTC